MCFVVFAVGTRVCNGVCVCMQTWRIKKLPSACFASFTSLQPFSLLLSVERLIELLFEQFTVDAERRRFGERCDDDDDNEYGGDDDDDTDPSLGANKLFDIFNEFALREMVMQGKEID